MVADLFNTINCIMIDAIKNGNEKAFEQAYILYREKLFGYLVKKTNSAEDAKDLLQIVFSKLWQYRRSLSADYLLEQHLFHIARTVFIDYLRKENTLQKIKGSARLHNSAYQPEDQIYGFDTEAHLQNLLSGMPVLRKQVFELYKIEGFSYKEIAEILSISVKSVDNNLAKALKYLRKASAI
jgi:RNA polymerase sigma-70 factor (ECF subfamily)